MPMDNRAKDGKSFPRVRQSRDRYGGLERESRSNNFPVSTEFDSFSYNPASPLGLGINLDDLNTEYRSEIHDLWGGEDRSSYISGRSSPKTYQKFHKNQKRPVSASSSCSSSVSSINFKKTDGQYRFRPTERESHPTDGYFKSKSKMLFETEEKQNPAHKQSYRGTTMSNGHLPWKPQPPSQAQHQVKFSNGISTIDLNDENLAHSYTEKIQRLTQERDSFSLQVSHYRHIAETSQSDLAAMKVKNGSLQEEVRKGQKRFSQMEQEVIDLKCEVEGGKQDLARQNALVNSFQQRVKDTEDLAKERENLISRNDASISSLKRELQSQHDQKHQIETSLKYHINVEEENTRKAETWEGKFREMCAQLCVALSLDTDETSSTARDLIITKANEISKENEMLTSKVNSVMYNVQSKDLEAKANRETIMRLVSDIGKEQKLSVGKSQQTENLTRERDVATQKVRELELELSALKDKLNQSQEAWTSARRELEDKDLRLSKVEKKATSYEYSHQKKENKLKQFRRQLAEILSDVGMAIEESEDEILKGVKAIQVHLKSFKNKDDKLQSRVSTLADELSNQRNLQKSTLVRAGEAETRIHDLCNRVRNLEGELLAADVERDRLNEEKRKYTMFLDKIAHAMKLNEIGHDIEFDLTVDSLIVRAEQLTKSETESIQDRTTTIYNLQRKLKTLKNQGESKDFQLNVMKKKVSELEELLKERGTYEKEKGDSSILNKKLQRKCEKLLEELSNYKELVLQLKAKLMETGELTVQNMEQKKAIDQLEGTINRLAKSKHKSTIELADIKKEFKHSIELAKSDETERVSAIQQIQGQLNITQETLEDSRKKEQQLHDFRQAIANILGLEIENLSVPDYEIISRLERIVQAHHSRSVAAHNLESTLYDMNSDFKSGYTDAMSILQYPELKQRTSCQILKDSRG